MRNNHDGTINKKIVTLLMAAALMASAMTIAIPLSAMAATNTVSAGTGQGSIFYTAHRVPGNWDPCFATSCDAGSGPGATMFFTVYDSSLKLVASGQANEDGVFIKGLVVGGTYYVSPEDCESCHTSTHDVLFDHWWDCSTTVQQRPFEITSASTISAAAYYRIWEHGDPNNPASCTPTSAQDPTGNPTPTPTPTPTPSDDNTPVRHRHRASVDVAELDSILNIKQALINSFEPTTASSDSTTTASDNGTTTISAAMIPDTNLSGVPLGRNGVTVTYNSMYDIVNNDPEAAIKAMITAQQLGINWDSLSDMQKAYLVLTLQYSMSASSNMIPDTNLSGVPLGPDGKTIEYKSLYDISSNNSDGLIKAMQAADYLGINWDSLSDMQKAYLATVLSYGAPQK
jgi:hypothetical protein